MRRPFIASVSGKGGAGKTTLVALLLKVLIESQCDDLALIVDADPATNLPEVLGVRIGKTIGDVAEEFRRRVGGNVDLSSADKASLLQYWILKDCLVELKHFDFLAMGRGEGEGCYCYVNLLLTKILVELVKNYSVVIMDMEAGLEHLSRRVDRHANTIIVVVDPSVMSLRTAERIMAVAKEVNVTPEKYYIVGNRIPASMVEAIAKHAERMGYEYAGTIPEDENIAIYSSEGRPLLELPSNSPALLAARSIAKSIGLID